MGVPFEIGPVYGQQAKVLSGQTLGWVVVECPWRCRITKLIVYQTGTSDAFDVSLYCSKKVKDGTVPAGIDPRCYRIGPLRPAVTGAVEYYADGSGGYGLPYINKDSPAPERAQRGGASLLYILLKMTVAPGADRLFSIVVGGETFLE